MKTKTFLLAALVGLSALGVLHASDDAATNVSVSFDQPENYSDIGDGFNSTAKGKAANLEGIKQYVQKQAKKYLPADQKLEITFTNIDLAGEFEPWDATMDDIRIVKDIYPPRIDLQFRVMDASGKVVREGERKLRDLSFMMNLRLNNNDPLRYEKTLIDDWMRKDVRPTES
ncbi:MAG: hypothetical protein CMI16_04960 [Opitutaceae bacterium]|nr:hypothetical protein [Opitutaceae bacterium]